MNNWILPLAVIVVLTLGTAVLSICAWIRAGFAFKAAAEHSEEAARETEEQFAALAKKLDHFEAQLASRACPPSPASVRPGMNLNKRSQALQLHRRGEPPEAIAAALGLPRQEIDLLVKVHTIVLGSI